MTIRSRCIEILEQGPSTTRDIALELCGDDSWRSLNRIGSHMRLMRAEEFPVRIIGTVLGISNRRLKLWAIDEGGA